MRNCQPCRAAYSAIFPTFRRVAACARSISGEHGTNTFEFRARDNRPVAFGASTRLGSHEAGAGVSIDAGAFFCLTIAIVISVWYASYN